MSHIALAIAATATATFAHAGMIIFEDNFDTENGGSGALNYTGFSQWSVADGSVDLLGNNLFNFFPGNGLYVELDGSMQNAARFESVNINLQPGLYEFAFLLLGQNPQGSFANNTAVVTVGSFYTTNIAIANQGPISTQFVVDQPTTVKIIFDHAGGDNGGLIIDNVRLERIPAPASTALLAVAGLAAIRRRRV